MAAYGNADKYHGEHCKYQCLNKSDKKLKH